MALGGVTRYAVCMRSFVLRFALIAVFLGLGFWAYAQRPSGVGQGWEGEFDLASSHNLDLAKAIPEAKYGWRPGPGIRSCSEVFMHIAVGNYFLLGQAGIKVPGAPKIDQNTEKTVTAKAEVIDFLLASQDAVRKGSTGIDRKKAVKFFGQDSTVDGVLLRLLVHNHEHMGQMIAYARMNGVAPPWTGRPGE